MVITRVSCPLEPDEEAALNCLGERNVARRSRPITRITSFTTPCYRNGGGSSRRFLVFRQFGNRELPTFNHIQRSILSKQVRSYTKIDIIPS
jgi:hypothetical protein